jgi:hypothetical protein
MRDKPGVLLLVENHSVPADRRVWGEARSLARAGYRVSVICPRGRHMDRKRIREEIGWEKSEEQRLAAYEWALQPRR